MGNTSYMGGVGSCSTTSEVGRGDVRNSVRGARRRRDVIVVGSLVTELSYPPWQIDHVYMHIVVHICLSMLIIYTIIRNMVIWLNKCKEL